MFFFVSSRCCASVPRATPFLSVTMYTSLSLPSIMFASSLLLFLSSHPRALPSLSISLHLQSMSHRFVSGRSPPSILSLSSMPLAHSLCHLTVAVELYFVMSLSSETKRHGVGAWGQTTYLHHRAILAVDKGREIKIALAPCLAPLQRCKRRAMVRRHGCPLGHGKKERGRERRKKKGKEKREGKQSKDGGKSKVRSGLELL